MKSRRSKKHKNTPKQSEGIVNEQLTNDWAKVTAMMGVASEEVWKRKCRELVNKLLDEHPEWDKSHEPSYHKRYVCSCCGDTCCFDHSKVINGHWFCLNCQDKTNE